jgi:hypothetical protein
VSRQVGGDIQGQNTIFDAFTPQNDPELGFFSSDSD